jgi:hypothetical protein
MLEEEERAPFKFVPVVVVPEGFELLLVLLEDPGPELLELPAGVELEGGAREVGKEILIT